MLLFCKKLGYLCNRYYFMRKKTVISIGIFVALVMLLFFLKSTIFRYALNQKVQSIEQKYDLHIRYSGLRITGLSNVLVDSLYILHRSSNTSVTLTSIYAKVSIPHLLKLKTKPKGIPANKNYVDSDSLPYMYGKALLLNRLNSMAISLSKSVYNLYTNSSISCASLFLEYGKNERIHVSAGKFESIRGNSSSNFIVSSINGNDHFFVKSKVNPENHSAIFSVNFQNSYTLPLIESELGTCVGMDSLNFHVKGASLKNRGMHLKLQSKFYGLHIQSGRLAESTVFIDSLGFSLSSRHSAQAIAVDSASHASFNQITIPFCLTSTVGNSPQVTLNVSDHIFAARNIFESIPKGLFKSVEDMEVDGNVSFALNLNIDFNQPDSLKIFAKLTPKNFRIIQYGKIDFRELNENFTYKIYLNDTTTKEIVIDTLNPNFCPLNRISQHIINSVIISEDGGFFIHKGFDSEAFSYAISRNIKDKKLARGGSTITMQLVKNLYLNRSKNIARKAEEALIVWLIESQRLVSKERMLEIYFNIIDWGPNIHGVTEAAQFYFQKKPIDIDLNEAIFLASIIPRPSYFTSYFNSNLELRKYMPEYFQNLSSIMLLRRMISEEEFESLDASVELKGESKQMLELQKIAN